MIDPQKVSQLKELIERSQTICVIYSPDSNLDQLAIATSLFLSFKAREKDVRLLSTAANSGAVLEGLDQTLTEIGNQNLSISFPYVESAVDKVNYHIGEDSGRFFLTIKPKKNSQPLSVENVEFSYTGADFDLIFLVGVDQLESLEQLYFGYENMFRNAPVISINSYETEFGLIKLDLSGGASESEEFAQLMFEMDMDFSEEIATNLLSGISFASNNFSSMSASAQTFEIISKLMRLGARRVKTSAQTAQAVQPVNKLKSKTKSKPKEVEISPAKYKNYQHKQVSDSHRKS